MAVPSLDSMCTVVEYLTTSYRPDCEFVDGRLEIRNLGEYDHATVQSLLIAWFINHDKAWGLRTRGEVRVQVSESRFRVPDICVLRREDLIEQIIRRPPLVCIEVLCPEDTVQRMLLRLDDYRMMGIEHIWLIDPSTHKGYVFTSGGLNQPGDDTFAVPGTPIHVPLAEILAELGER